MQVADKTARTASTDVQVFDFLGIEASIDDNDKISARATGVLGAHVQPFVDQFIGVLNSLKVIAKKGRANVFNLYNPPQPTKAGMRALERKVKEIIFKRVFPATANMAITHRCQCKCVHCSADPFVDPDREELTTSEIKTVLDAALDLGSSLVILVGGEPLLRKDLFELIAHIDPDKAMPMIFTNGQLLERNAEKLAEAGLQTLNISIDSFDPEVHNTNRCVDGLYDAAFAGARKARDVGILTGISTYATSQSLDNGNVESLLKFAQDEGFQEVTIFDCIPSGRFLKDPSVMLSTDEKKRVSDLARRFHEMSNPMGVVAQAIVNSPVGAGCFGAYAQFYMTAYGDINPCDFNPLSFGNVRELPLQAIWHKMISHKDFCEKHPTCRMQTPEYRARYIDPLPDNPRLPVTIEEIESGNFERITR